ncbi:5-formyltetrahydrofolate cyclo-ligase [Brevundimonas sp.]|uniref:5-formyltetrahydrofolate cyclo-ligase n=1 Tax=Brevundimonas sp. TaxID=1871086 RepID=UPI0025CBBF54|nr:5-formyltetrahydrofolate cyclo-ligase [Brevundimonas sp.]
MSKADLRSAARARRKALAVADPGAAGRAACHAETMLDALFGTMGGWPEEVRRGRRLTVALYRPMGSEIDPAPLARALIGLSCDLCLPVVERLDAPLVFRAWTTGQALRPDLVGSAAPLPDAPQVNPDLIIAPLLAFDAFGHRLGQGGGYYDRTFAARPDAVRVGLAWAAQQVERLPAEGHDMPLHGVLTESGYMPAGKAD